MSRKSLFTVIGVFLLLPTFAFAQERKFGSWTVVRSDDKQDLIAATTVDDDKYLAYRCFGSSGQCAHVFNLAAECEDGKEYPVLINGSHAALAITCTCSDNDGSYELVPDYEDFHRVLARSTGYLGFALPLASGQFKVVRFNLNGANQAMKAAENVRKDSSQYR